MPPPNTVAAAESTKRAELTRVEFREDERSNPRYENDRNIMIHLMKKVTKLLFRGVYNFNEKSLKKSFFFEIISEIFSSRELEIKINKISFLSKN